MRLPKSKGIYYPREIFESDAYWKLTGTQIRVLNIFYLKRRLAGGKEAKKMKVSVGTVKNNGQIIFTYKEAESYGIKKDTFTRARDKLIIMGFIDITKLGGNREAIRYSISERWKKIDPDAEPEIIRKKISNQLIGYKTRFKIHPQKCG